MEVVGILAVVAAIGAGLGAVAKPVSNAWAKVAITRDALADVPPEKRDKVIRALHPLLTDGSEGSVEYDTPES